MVSSDLKTGDRLRTPAGELREVVGTHAWTEMRTVYNLTVDDMHTYYVAAGSAAVLVHNAKVDKKCKLQIDHVGQVAPDWVQEGAHVNLKDGMEVVIRADGKGGIVGEGYRLEKGTATQKQVDAVIDTLKTKPKVRKDLLRVTKAALEKFEYSAKAMKEGQKPEWTFENDRSAELRALIEALEKM